MNSKSQELQLAPAQLPAAVAHLNALHGEVCAALDRAWQTGVVLGMELTMLKEALPHGEFGKLFGEAKTDTCVRFEFTDRNARRYMELYRACLECAGRLDRRDAVVQMLDGYRAAYALEHNRKGELMRRHAARELSRTLKELAPQATSMRQAMLIFAEDEPEPPAATTPHFTAPNRLGQIRREEDDAAAVASVSAELDTLRGQMDELITSGRITLATAESRAALALTARTLLDKLKQIA